MRTQIVERNQWESFMDEFSRLHDGWLASIEVTDPGGARQVIAEDLPFMGISAEVGVGGRDYMNIRVGRTDVDSIIHRIASPERVYFMQTGDGAQEGARIESKDGEHTLLRFVAPGEEGGKIPRPRIGV